MLEIHLLFYISLFLGFVNAGRELTTHAIRSTTFDEAQKGKRLQNEGSLLVLKFVNTQLECALACGRHVKCRSFSFCGKRLCYLNADDVFSTVKGASLLQNDQTCTYFGMREHWFPICEENGKPVSIRDDTSSRKCEINLKRVDKQWSEWEIDTLDIDSASEYKKTRSREEILDSAHGGISEGTSVEVTIWLKFISMKTNWIGARDNCLLLGGKLFYGLDGTVEQARFLFERSGNEPSWSGIFKNDQLQFVTVDGGVVSNDVFNWRPGNPGTPDENRVLFGWDGSYMQVDIGDGYSLRSICDLK